jgi:S1-C subfamily serine protease
MALVSGVIALGAVVGRAKILSPRELRTQVKEKEANPLGFVKWFDPASVGIVVEAAEGGLRVKHADEGKPFAKAGLRAGDLAVSADGKDITSPDVFRRLLRGKVVMEEELTLEVKRDGQVLKLVVPFKG